MGKKRKGDGQVTENDLDATSMRYQASAVHAIRERKQVSAPILEPEVVASRFQGKLNRPHVEENAKADTSVKQLSQFVPTNKDTTSCSKDSITIRLDDDTLTLIGQYEIWVRKGAISILGAVLYPSSAVHRVFAPSTHSLPVIRPVRNPFGPPEQPIEITILSFQCGIRLLKHVSPMFGLVWNKATDLPGDLEPDSSTISSNSIKRTYSLLKPTEGDGHTNKRPLGLVEIPDDWQALMAALISKKQVSLPTSALICGPKGSGKSTFARMLVNGLLKFRSVALLDIDPGQPEFSPPGEVSLVQVTSYNFGPSFCHPNASEHGIKLIRSHHIGATSPQDDTHNYQRCVINLFEHYKQLLKLHPLCPLVVNTAGWIQGTGLELVSDLIRQLNLTDVIYTSTSGPSEVVDSISQATEEGNTRLHFLTSQPVEAVPRSAADLRAMQTLSYFHLDEPELGHIRWNATPIDDMNTLPVHYSGSNQSIYAVQLLGPELDPEFLGQVLEGCIVGLVVVDDDAALPIPFDMIDGDVAFDQPQDSTPSASYHNLHSPLPRTPEQIPYIPSTAHLTPPLSPTHSHSIGQAYIRAIDTESHIFHLITPVPHATFTSLHKEQKKLVLVRGSLDTPTWAYKEGLFKQMRHHHALEKEGLGEGREWAKEDTKRWAEGRPWVSAEGRRKGERVKKVRKDLGRKKTKR
ncbi:MAG: hypothetical protein Q9186_007397 [Xanthomendoza sp. 1 TL-2023]